MNILRTTSHSFVSSSDYQSLQCGFIFYIWSRVSDELACHDAHLLFSVSPTQGDDGEWLSSRALVRCIVHTCSLRLEWDWALWNVHLSHLPSISANALSLEGIEIVMSSLGRFTRLWALPKFLASQRVEFFQSEWNFICVKDSNSLRDRLELLSRLSSLDAAAPVNQEALFSISPGLFLSWAEDRQTARPEDDTSILAGICGVGGWFILHPQERKPIDFHLLQQKTAGRTRLGDLSIMAWERPQREDRGLVSEMLTDSPADFIYFNSSLIWTVPLAPDTEIAFDSRGVRLQNLLSHRRVGGDAEIMFLVNATRYHLANSEYLGTMLKEAHPGPFTRSIPWKFETLCLCKEDINLRPIHVSVVDGDDAVRCWGTISRKESRILAWVNSIQQPPATGRGRPPKRSAEEMMEEWETLSYTSCLDGWSSATSSGGQEEEEDIFLLDSLPERQELLDDGHPLIHLLPVLVAYGARSWENNKISCRSHGTPVFPSPRPRKRARRGQPDPLGTLAYEESEDTASILSSSPSRVLVRPSDTPPSHDALACPFYRLSPSGHYSCLWLLHLPTMRSLIQHLIVHHRLPYYCPMCQTVFPTGADRDRHIVARCCERWGEDVTRPLGVSEDQAEKLASTSELLKAAGLGDEARWLRTWNILFPGLPNPVPDSAFLSKPREREVLALRRFWDDQGRALVSRELEKRQLIRWDYLGGGAALDALHVTVLKGILEVSGLAGE